MVKHTQTIYRQHPTYCLSVFDHFVALALKGLKFSPLFDISRFLAFWQVVSSCIYGNMLRCQECAKNVIRSNYLFIMLFYEIQYQIKFELLIQNIWLTCYWHSLIFFSYFFLHLFALNTKLIFENGRFSKQSLISVMSSFHILELNNYSIPCSAPVTTASQ